MNKSSITKGGFMFVSEERGREDGGWVGRATQHFVVTEQLEARHGLQKLISCSD